MYGEYDDYQPRDWGTGFSDYDNDYDYEPDFDEDLEDDRLLERQENEDFEGIIEDQHLDGMYEE